MMGPVFLPRSPRPVMSIPSSSVPLPSDVRPPPSNITSSNVLLPTLGPSHTHTHTHTRARARAHTHTLTKHYETFQQHCSNVTTLLQRCSKMFLAYWDIHIQNVNYPDSKLRQNDIILSSNDIILMLACY